MIWMLLSCSGSPGEPVQVFAAASLIDAFGELEGRFERAHPGVDLQTTYAGSHLLRLQIEQGAGADVFASADPVQMAPLTRTGVVHSALPFASNTLALITPLDDPARISTLEDLPRASRIVVGDIEAPIGRYTEELLEAADQRYGNGFSERVRTRVVSRESNVRMVRAKVELGEADAAIVYASDVGPRVRSVALPAGLEVSAPYVVGLIGDDPAAAAFSRYLRSPEAAEVLTARGFWAP